MKPSDGDRRPDYAFLPLGSARFVHKRRSRAIYTSRVVPNDCDSARPDVTEETAVVVVGRDITDKSAAEEWPRSAERLSRRAALSS